MTSESHSPTELFCHRCGKRLQPGRGNWYVARIEAFADPTPPEFSAADLDQVDPGEEIDKLIEQMSDLSPRELMDQVYRTVTLHLCGRCYASWIEDPVGGG